MNSKEIEMKEIFYQNIEEKIKKEIGNETDMTANMAKIIAILSKELKDINWIGFYIKIEDMLMLGPFYGDTVPSSIENYKGICGMAAKTSSNMIIGEVKKFPFYMKYYEETMSEMAIPLTVDEKVQAVLDIDSPVLNRFDNIDAEKLSHILMSLFS